MAALQAIGTAATLDDELALYGDRIDSSDATDLRLFFRSSGMACFFSSEMGAMMDRAELFARHARPCTACGGNRRLNIGGCGWAPSSKEKRKPTAHEAEMLKWEKSRKKLLPPRSDTPCTKCKGMGWRDAGRRRVAIENLTARPTGSSVPLATSVDVGHVGLIRLASVGRRLDWVAAQWPPATDILETYYGPDVEQLMGLWVMTPAGKTLLRRNHLGLDPLRFFENERTDNEDRKDAGRAATFRAADDQAQDLLLRAHQLWNAACVALSPEADATP